MQCLNKTWCIDVYCYCFHRKRIHSWLFRNWNVLKSTWLPWIKMRIARIYDAYGFFDIHWGVSILRHQNRKDAFSSSYGNIQENHFIAHLIKLKVIDTLIIHPTTIICTIDNGCKQQLASRLINWVIELLTMNILW